MINFIRRHDHRRDRGRLSPSGARDARIEAVKLACTAWSERILGFKKPARPSPIMLGDALNAGFRYLEVRCAGCDLHSTVGLTTVRRPEEMTPIHELERRMACRDCSQIRGYRYKRGQLVALRQTPISASEPPSVWWPGER